MIQNNNFGVLAGTLDHWTHTGSITDPGGTTSHDFVIATAQKSHSTRFSASMLGNQSNFSGSLWDSELSQSFAPTKPGSITELSFWTFSYGQDLTVKLDYTDGTSTYLSHFFENGINEATDPNGGWEKWDITSLVANKSLDSITFKVEAGFLNNGNDLYIDDVTVKGTVASVPGPASLVAFAVGGLRLARRRKK